MAILTKRYLTILCILLLLSLGIRSMEPPSGQEQKKDENKIPSLRQLATAAVTAFLRTDRQQKGVSFLDAMSRKLEKLEVVAPEEVRILLARDCTGPLQPAPPSRAIGSISHFKRDCCATQPIGLSGTGSIAVLGFCDGMLEVLDLQHEGVEHQALLNSCCTAIDANEQHCITGHQGGGVVLWYLRGHYQNKAAIKDLHPQAVTAVAASPQYCNQFASGSQDGTVALLHSRLDQAPLHHYVLDRNGGRIQKLVFSSQGSYLISGSHEGRVKIWHTGNRKSIFRDEYCPDIEVYSEEGLCTNRGICALALNEGNERLIVAQRDAVLRVINIHTKKEQLFGNPFCSADRQPGPLYPPAPIALSRDGRYLLSHTLDAYKAGLWDLYTNRVMYLGLHDLPPSQQLRGSFDHCMTKVILAGHMGDIRIWDIAKLKEQKKGVDPLGRPLFN